MAPRRRVPARGAARRPRARLAAVGALLVLAPGCRSALDRDGLRAAWDDGRYEKASALLAKAQERDPADRHLWSMERSLCALATGRPEVAVRELRGARDRIAELDPPYPTTWDDAGALFGKLQASLTDDRVLPYPGRDYEQQLVFALLSLSELLADGGDVVAYGLQGLEDLLAKQEELGEGAAELWEDYVTYEGIRGGHPKRDYRLVAFGEYLRAALLEVHPTRGDAARRAYERVLALAPDCELAARGLERLAGEGVEPGERRYGALHVVTFTGRVPQVVQTTVDPRVGDLLNLIKVLWSFGQGRAAFPFIPEIPIPTLAPYDVNPATVHVWVDGDYRGTTSTVTDVELAARAELAAVHDEVVARAVLRRALKLTLSEVAKHNMKADDLGYLLFDVGAALLTQATERADLRSWSLLPARLQALRLDVPPGTREVVLRAGDARGEPVGPPLEIALRHQEGYDSWVLGIVPGFDGGPPPLSPSAVRPGEELPPPAPPLTEEALEADEHVPDDPSLSEDPTEPDDAPSP